MIQLVPPARRLVSLKATGIGCRILVAAYAICFQATFAHADSQAIVFCDALEQGLMDCVSEAASSGHCPQATSSVDAAYGTVAAQIGTDQRAQIDRANRLWHDLADDVVPAGNGSADGWPKKAKDLTAVCYSLRHPSNY